jgi:hypothetical protein
MCGDPPGTSRAVPRLVVILPSPTLQMSAMEKCAVCSSELQGRQRKFCSRFCKNRYTNYHHQSYESQQARGRERKLNLIAMLGGECIRCGYNRNFGALEFHHIDPALKQYQLDMRSLAKLDGS